VTVLDALSAFVQEHERCGDLDSGLDGDYIFFQLHGSGYGRGKITFRRTCPRVCGDSPSISFPSTLRLAGRSCGHVESF